MEKDHHTYTRDTQGRRRRDDDRDSGSVVRARAVLALTATATQRTAEEICRVLKIDIERGGKKESEGERPQGPRRIEAEEEDRVHDHTRDIAGVMDRGISNACRTEPIDKKKQRVEGERAEENGIYFGGWQRSNLQYVMKEKKN